MKAKSHELKVEPSFFVAVKNGRKHFELRKNDRDFQVNDEIVLRSFDGTYTGGMVSANIDFILEGYEGLENGFAILSLGNINIIKEQ